MFTRSRRQASVSSKAEIGSEMKRTKSKNSAKTGSVPPEEELKPKVLFKVPKDGTGVRNSKHNSTGLIHKENLDKFLDKLVERNSKSTNKSGHNLMSSSTIAQK
jgi:hypothetical protein